MTLREAIAPGYVATGGAQAVGLILGNAMPVIVGSLVVGSGLSNSTAGGLVTLEFAAMAVVGLLTATRVHRIPLSRLALAGTLLAAAAQTASAFAVPVQPSSLAGFAVLRTLAGIGEGLVLAAANAGLARVANSARLYGAAAFVAAITSAALLAILPAIAARWAGGPYALLALALLLPATTYRRLPPIAVIVADRVRSGSEGTRAPAAARSEIVVTASAVFLFSTALGALWSFSELLGTRLGLSSGQAAQALAVNLVAGLAGSATAAWLGDRARAFRAWLLGAVGIGVVAAWMGAMHVPQSYYVAQAIYGFLYLYAMTFMMSANARLDANGRVVTIAGALVLAGFSLGPALGGITADAYGIAGVASGVSGALALAAGLIAWLAGQAGRREQLVSHRI